MARRLPSAEALTLALLLLPCAALAQAPPPAVVPTGKTVTTTPAPAVAPATKPPAGSAAAPPTSKPSSPPAAAPAPTAAAPENTVERARRGVVIVERAGRPLALGVVLDGDGRILTALSALGNGNFVTVRYHDGVTSPVKLVHNDRGWDLALLAPEKQDHKAGVRAAKSVALGNLQLLTLAAPPNTVTAAPAVLKPAAPLLGGDARSLTDAYELGARPAYVGGPIVNPAGEVVALVARACPAGSGAGCVPAPYGAPVTAIRQFLRRIPAETTWLGIDGAADELGGVRGVRVISLSAGSPAQSAGLRAGKDAQSADLVIAVNGTPVATPAELNEAMRAHVAGESAELLVYGMRRYRQVTVNPRPAPELTTKPYVPRPNETNPRTPNPYR